MPLGIEEILGDSLPVIDGFDDTEGSPVGAPLGIDDTEGSDVGDPVSSGRAADAWA